MSTNPPVVSLKDQQSERLGEEITELYAYITAATHDLLLKIRKFDEDGLWEQVGLCSTAHWLNWKCGIGMNAAREKVRVARALGELPKISEAFRQGEISYSKVRAMTRVANRENEDYLMMIARYGTAHHVETLVRGYRRAERLNGPDVAAQQYESRSFTYHWDDDGSLVFKGRLPAEVGAMLMKALQSAIDHKDVTAETSDEGEQSDAISQRRADAVAEMAESYLQTGPAQSSSADRYQVMLHVSAETTDQSEQHGDYRHCEEHSDETILQTSPQHLGGLAPNGTIENGPHVTAETSRRICCDTSLSKLTEDEKGDPLSIGRKSRVIPPAMRRALKARDKDCRFPGCTHQYFIDGHHIRHWADGGETSLDNLVQLCRHHHRLVHEGGFSCERDESGNVVFRDRENALIPEFGHIPRFRGNVIAGLEEILENRHIDSKTILPDWHGETMDQHLAVETLWDIEQSRSGQAYL